MRRRALSLLAKAWRTRDHRGLAVLDLACGTGAFLSDLAVAFPRARLIGVDLSPAYLAEAHAAAPGAALVQAKAEQLPFADASLDAVTCVYLFHELPPKVRAAVAAEIARVLKPGGRFALANSIQPTDEPRLGRLLEAFPAYFHEPFFAELRRDRPRRPVRRRRPARWSPGRRLPHQGAAVRESVSVRLPLAGEGVSEADG